MTGQPRSWKAFATQADGLLASLAFPGSREAFQDAERRAAEQPRMRRALGASALHRGDDSGHDGTTTRHPFDLGIAEWLVERFPGDVEIDWSNDAVDEAVDALLRPHVRRAEEDGYDSDSLTRRAWVRLARGTAWQTDLAWLLHTLRDSRDSLSQRTAAWEDAALPIVWKLRGAGVLHARLRLAEATTRSGFRATPARAAQMIAKPLRDVRLLARPDADQVIQVARETLAVRCREVHAISYANGDEVWLADLGLGTSIAIIGVIPELRLSLEANYGFVLFSNGVPIGYGGVSPLFRQANTGINIFSPFRGTEAGMLWVRALQAFHALFGSKRFIANPFQIGGGNSEAIDSGAFWFYYRLGFRPSAPALATLAEAEHAKRSTNHDYKTPKPILKRLAGADLVLTLPGFGRKDAFDEPWLANLALRGTGRIAAEGRLPRHRAAGRITKRVANALGMKISEGTRAERAAFERLAPIVDAIPDLGRWPVAEKRRLAKLMQAKGHPQERDFVVASASSQRLFNALTELATQTSPETGAPVVPLQTAE